MATEFLGAAVLGHDQNGKGFRLTALHAGRAHGHSRHGEAQGIGVFIEEASECLGPAHGRRSHRRRPWPGGIRRAISGMPSFRRRPGRSGSSLMLTRKPACRRCSTQSSQQPQPGLRNAATSGSPAAARLARVKGRTARPERPSLRKFRRWYMETPVWRWACQPWMRASSPLNSSCNTGLCFALATMRNARRP